MCAIQQTSQPGARRAASKCEQAGHTSLLRQTVPQVVIQGSENHRNTPYRHLCRGDGLLHKLLVHLAAAHQCPRLRQLVQPLRSG